MRATAKNVRLKFDASRWYASKLNPKVYGDRLEYAGAIDMNVGLADLLEAARKRVLAATGAPMIEGLVEAVPPAPPAAVPCAPTDQPESAE
jgi:hypothetical protein